MLMQATCRARASSELHKIKRVANMHSWLALHDLTCAASIHRVGICNWRSWKCANTSILARDESGFWNDSNCNGRIKRCEEHDGVGNVYK
jgi:hypothetical protein